MATTSQNNQGEQNPFRVQKDNEMLLVLRENERKFKNTFKNEVEGLRVFEKTTANKQNRQGCIRRVNQIPAKKKKGKKSDERGLNDDSKE